MDQLDNATVTNIFVHVEPADVARLRAVCRGWAQVIEQAQVCDFTACRAPSKLLFYVVATIVTSDMMIRWRELS